MDLTTEILRAATMAGVRKVAMVDIMARGQAVFANATPDAVRVQQWVFGLQTEAPHLFGDGPPDADSGRGRAAEHLARGLAVPAKKRRPAPVLLSAEQAAALAQLSPTARLTRYRELQAAKD